MKEKTIGILISKKNYSESSVVLSFYTEELGLISFIFKGARKKKIPLFYLGIYEIAYFKRPESNLGIINTIDPVIVLADIYINPQKLILSFFLVDVLKETLKVEQPDKQVFNFIKIQILELEVQEDLIFFPIKFLSSLLQNLGFSPIFEDENPKGFDLKNGKFTKELTDFDDETIRVLHSAFAHIPINSDRISGHKALNILMDYCKIHLPNFNVDKSLKVIRETLYA